MTILEVIENLADHVRLAVKEYSTEQKAGHRPVKVYAGPPPVRGSNGELESFIYCAVTGFTDKEDGHSTVEVEVGFSIYDKDRVDGWRTVYNLVEHVRQAMLKKRILGGRNALILPLKGELIFVQPFPQWQARITATYTIAHIEEEGLDYDETFRGQCIR